MPKLAIEFALCGPSGGWAEFTGGAHGAFFIATRYGATVQAILCLAKIRGERPV